MKNKNLLLLYGLVVIAGNSQAPDEVSEVEIESAPAKEPGGDPYESLADVNDGDGLHKGRHDSAASITSNSSGSLLMDGLNLDGLGNGTGRGSLVGSGVDSGLGFDNGNALVRPDSVEISKATTDIVDVGAVAVDGTGQSPVVVQKVLTPEEQKNKGAGKSLIGLFRKELKKFRENKEFREEKGFQEQIDRILNELNVLEGQLARTDYSKEAYNKFLSDLSSLKSRYHMAVEKIEKGKKDKEPLSLTEENLRIQFPEMFTTEIPINKSLLPWMK